MLFLFLKAESNWAHSLLCRVVTDRQLLFGLVLWQIVVLLFTCSSCFKRCAKLGYIWTSSSPVPYLHRGCTMISCSLSDSWAWILSILCCRIPCLESAADWRETRTFHRFFQMIPEEFVALVVRCMLLLSWFCPSAVCLSRCPSVCFTHTGDPRLNGSVYRNMLCTTW